MLIVGVSDESEGELDKFIKEFGPKFPILQARTAGAKYGVSGYPSGVILDPEQKVMKLGHPGSFTQADFDHALKGVRLWPDDLSSEGPFKAMKAAFVEGKNFGDLAAAVEKLAAQPGLSDADRAGAERVKKLLDQLVGSATAEIEHLTAGPDYLGAQQRLEEIVKSFDRLAPSAKAKATLDAFKKDANVQKELTAQKKLAAFQKQLDAAKNPNAKKKLIPELKTLTGQLKGTYAGLLAQELQAELQKLDHAR